MVLSFALNFTYGTVWWSLQRTYDLVYYMLYGNLETKEDKILKQIEEIKKQNLEERKELEELKNKIRNDTNIYKLLYEEYKKKN